MPIESKTWNRQYLTGPKPHLNGRTLGQARGRGLGGSSSINDMVWVRGSFQGGTDPNRGGDGPLQITRSRASHPFYETFLRAGEAYGLPVARDYNSDSIEGVHFTQATIHAGRRQSTAVTYLHTVARRPNLTVLTGWRADRVVLEGGRATGVSLRRVNGTQTLHAGREVILCAGTIGTPHLMLLSGIGPADHLRNSGVTVKRDLPGVDENLRNHFVASLTFRASGTRSIASDCRSGTARA